MKGLIMALVLIAATLGRAADYAADGTVGGLKMYQPQATNYNQVMLDGHVFSGAGQVVYSTGQIQVPIVVTKEGGGNFSGKIYGRTVGGRATQTYETSLNVFGKVDSHQANASLRAHWQGGHAMTDQPTASGFGQPFEMLPFNVAGSDTVQMVIEWRDAGGNVVEDSVTVEFTMHYDYDVQAGYVGAPMSFTVGTVPTIYLYDEGVLPPTGRPGAGAGGFDKEFSGTVTNNSGEDQTVILMGIDEQGNSYAIMTLEIPASGSATIPAGVGTDQAQDVYLLTSGVVEGVGSNAYGDGQHDISMSFPAEQKKQSYRLYVDEAAGDTSGGIRVVGGDGTQEFVQSGDSGTRAVEREYGIRNDGSGSAPASGSGGMSTGGGLTIEGASIGHSRQNTDGSFTLIVLPSGETAETESEATYIGSEGAPYVSAIIRTSTGNTINVNDAPVTQPQAAGGGVPGATGSASGGQVSSTISSGQLDAAARVLSEIRAELAAAGAAAMESFQGGESESDGEEMGTGPGSPGDQIGEAGEGLGNLIGEGTSSTGKVAALLDPSVIPTNPGFGTTSVITVPIAGMTTITLDFNNPVVSWIRGILLAFISVVWFVGMVKMIRA